MTSTTRSSFVDDLIPLILEASDHWWTQDYLRLACVSPSWLFYVRKKLYACPSIGSFSASAALVRTFQENPELLHLVSGIELQPMLRDHETTSSIAAQVSSIQYLLGLEGLKRVKLGGQLAKQAQRFLHALAFPDLVEEVVVDGGLLQDDCWHPFRSDTMEWDESLLYRFPSLKRLRFANLELDIIPPSAPCQFPINHLILDNVDIAGGFLCQIVGGASVDVLSISAKAASEYDEQVRLVLEHCDVRALEYQVRANQCSERSFLDGDATLPLRRLQLDGYTVDDALLAEIAQRCTGLAELTISGRCATIAPQEWTAFISAGLLASLTRLQLPGGTATGPRFEKWAPEDLLAIQHASHANRIHLSY